MDESSVPFVALPNILVLLTEDVSGDSAPGDGFPALSRENGEGGRAVALAFCATVFSFTESKSPLPVVVKNFGFLLVNSLVEEEDTAAGCELDRGNQVVGTGEFEKLK